MYSLGFSKFTFPMENFALKKKKLSPVKPN